MNSEDVFEPWHNFLKFCRDNEKNGKIKISSMDTGEEVHLTDFQIALQYVVGTANEIGYRSFTTEMLYHLIEALTDVDFDKCAGIKEQ